MSQRSSQTLFFAPNNPWHLLNKPTQHNSAILQSGARNYKDRWVQGRRLILLFKQKNFDVDLNFAISHFLLSLSLSLSHLK